VSESLAVGDAVLTLEAEDVDRNAILEFDIIEPISARDKTGNALTNRVSLLPPYFLRYFFFCQN
jgi:hypothetical protein